MPSNWHFHNKFCMKVFMLSHKIILSFLLVPLKLGIRLIEFMITISIFHLSTFTIGILFPLRRLESVNNCVAIRFLSQRETIWKPSVLTCHSDSTGNARWKRNAENCRLFYRQLRQSPQLGDLCSFLQMQRCKDRYSLKVAHIGGKSKHVSCILFPRSEKIWCNFVFCTLKTNRLTIRIIQIPEFISSWDFVKTIFCPWHCFC